MTDDEINAALKTVVLRVRGHIDALTHMIAALRAQPGFDHVSYERFLATFQLVAEQSQGWHQEYRTGYEETLSTLAKQRLPTSAPPPK